MENVWKIGSRWSSWGDASRSVLSIFRRNNIVFLGDDHKKRFLKEVKEGDYFAIADGYSVVAVAKAISIPMKLDDMGELLIPDSEKCIFDKSDAEYSVGVKVKIVDLEKPFLYKKMGTFFLANQIWQKVKDLYENNLNRFKISTSTCSLLDKGNGYKALFDFKTKFIIPIYQRPYSWTEKEINPFMNDIFNGFLGDSQDCKNPEPMFIGTMQLSQKKIVDRECNEFWQEVVDGQQRITTISILLKELKRIYPENPQLQKFQFNWLETHIHDTSQKDLEDYFSHPCEEIANDNEKERNPYKRNAAIIRDYLENQLRNEQHDLDIRFGDKGDKFVEYILGNVIFVVVETQAGLSKTIKIFNTINTTGLDLNGGDLFKIRMYEYMKDKRNFGEEAFGQISEVYDLIEKNNKEYASQYWIGDILSIYQKILIGKYDLPNRLFDFGWENFFEKLFDTVLGVKTDWEHFDAVKKNGLTLDLEDLKQIITVCKIKHENDVNFKNEGKYGNYESSRNMFSYKILNSTRYSKYASIEYLYLFNHFEDKQCYENFYKILVPLSKLMFCYSICYAKTVYKMHDFMKKIMKKIVEKQADDKIIDLIRKELGQLQKEESIEKELGKYIFENVKWKILICRLSEFLKMEETKWAIKDMQKQLFNTNFNIEHIHSREDEKKWDNLELLNSIGNLTMLEDTINKSIQNKPFKNKKIDYRNSSYATIKSLADSSEEEWNEENAKKRREKEVKKMRDWLLS